MARPRSTDVDDAIHDATLALLAESGFGRLTIERVADRAGVGKAAVYRRYASKDDLVAGAVEARLPLAEPHTDGDLRAAVRGLVADLRVALVGPRQGLRLLAALLDESHHDPRLLATWRRRVVEPRVELIDRVLRGHGGGHGTVDARTLGELALGGLVGRYISTGVVTPADGERLADILSLLVRDGSGRPAPIPSDGRHAMEVT